MGGEQQQCTSELLGKAGAQNPRYFLFGPCWISDAKSSAGRSCRPHAAKKDSSSV